jgi:flagellar biosynthesis/type III secretory pathway protein FliH
MSDRSIELAEQVLQRIVELKARGRKPTQVRMNPADYREISASEPSGEKTGLWGLTILVDSKTPVGAPIVTAPR